MCFCSACPLGWGALSSAISVPKPFANMADIPVFRIPTLESSAFPRLSPQALLRRCCYRKQHPSPTLEASVFAASRLTHKIHPNAASTSVSPAATAAGQCAPPTPPLSSSEPRSDLTRPPPSPPRSHLQTHKRSTNECVAALSGANLSSELS